MLKAILPKKSAHRVAVGEGFNGVCEVIVGSLFSGKQGSEGRQDTVEIKLVEGSEWGLGEAKIEEEQMAVGAEHAADFLEGTAPGGHVPEAKGDGDDVEGGVWEGEVECIGNQKMGEALGLGASEHGFAEVGAGDVCVWASALEGKGEVAASGGEVEDRGGVPGGCEASGADAPPEVPAEAEEVVGEIVALGDAGKERVNAMGLN